MRKSVFAWQLKMFAGASVLAMASQAIAQDVEGAEVGSASVAQVGTEASGGIEEIVVTAQKRAENIQDVPISITAMTAAGLSNSHVTDMTALQGAVPNFQINSFPNNPTSAAFYIRGVGVQESDPYLLPAVSVVVDGVVQGVNTGALVSLFDVERVEVLRGPQGTLFGANTTGGVVNIINKQPTGEFGGSARLAYGNYDRIEMAAALDLPIVDDLLAGRVTIQNVQRDGYIANRATGSDMGWINVTDGRAYLKLDPGGDFTATLKGEFNRARNGSPVIINRAVPGDLLYVPPGNPGLEFRAANNSVPDQADADGRGVALTMNWDNSPLGDLVSISSFRNLRTDIFTDQDSTATLTYDSHRVVKHRQFTQELRTTVNPLDNVELILGGFVLAQRYTSDQSIRQEALPNSHGRRSHTFQMQENQQYSAFAQTYVDVTDQLRLQGGIRFTHERTEAETIFGNHINPTGGPSVFSGDTLVNQLVAGGAKTWNELGGKIGVDYDFTRKIKAYAYYAHGFKSGGFTGRIAVAADLGPFNPEYVDTFEVGLKSDLLDNMLRVNLAVFYNKYKDMQLSNLYIALLPNGQSINSSTTLNAGAARTKGFEFETTLVPVQGLTLNGAVAYLDAKYTSFILRSRNGDRDMAGERLVNAPKWSANASANYKFDIAGGEASLFGQYTYTSSKYAGVSLMPLSRVPKVGLFNASADWGPRDAGWTIGAWGRNLSNKKYFATSIDFPGFFTIAQMGTPREYGLELKVRW